MLLQLNESSWVVHCRYLDNTWPHPERGSKRPWSFILSKNFWFNYKERIPYSALDQVSWSQNIQTYFKNSFRDPISKTLLETA